jgi:hypothetical protein
VSARRPPGPQVCELIACCRRSVSVSSAASCDDARCVGVGASWRVGGCGAVGSAGPVGHLSNAPVTCHPACLCDGGRSRSPRASHPASPRTSHSHSEHRTHRSQQHAAAAAAAPSTHAEHTCEHRTQLTEGHLARCRLAPPAWHAPHAWLTPLAPLAPPCTRARGVPRAPPLSFYIEGCDVRVCPHRPSSLWI